MKYRREIDGLRAIAVLPVMLFHAGFEVFSGGFIGVDVFFVISGYLITTIILTELETGKFSIIRFYERRARRILPALFLVMLASLPFAWLTLMPSDMKDFAQSLAAVAVFASNILFWRESGYFDSAAELKPLLHTWSLAVEEQYYVLFPLVLMAGWKLRRRWLVVLLSGCLFASLAIADWAAASRPAAAFYLLPTRGWELMIGALIAFYQADEDRAELGRIAREICGWLGLVLIAFAALVFDKETPFPGLYAVVPTVGAALIILFATERTTAGRLIGNQAFVGVGLISYSAYLWHQPMFSFARHAGLTNYDWLHFLGLIAITLLLATLSWRFVEVPFRNKTTIGRRGVFLFAITGTVLFGSLGVYGHKRNGDVGQLTTEQKQFLGHFENDLPAWNYFTRTGIPERFRDDCNFYDVAKYRAGYSTRVPVDKISSSCFTKTSPTSKSAFIWGDSHAQQLYHGLKENLPGDYEILQVASSGCAPSAAAKMDDRDFCEYSNWFALDSIKKIRPEVVFVGQNSNHDWKRMVDLAAALKAAGAKRIVFVGPSPHWNPSLPAVAARLFPNVPKRTYLGVDRGILELDRKLKLEFRKTEATEYVSLIDYFCNQDGCLVHYGPDIASNISSWDYGHLSPIASQHLARDVLAPLVTLR